MPTGRSISPRDGEGVGPRGWGPGWEGRWDLPAQFFRRRLKNLWNRPCLIESNSEKLSMLSPDLGPANRRSAPRSSRAWWRSSRVPAARKRLARARSRYRPAFGPEVGSEPDAAEIERRTALIRREKIMLDRVRRRG